MKRLMFGVLVAVFLSAAAFAQTDLTVSFTIPAAKAELLKDALTWRVSQMPVPQGQQPPTVNEAYMETWIKARCRESADQLVTQFERAEAQTGGALDVSTLTRAQRLQVKALIASFQK